MPLPVRLTSASVTNDALKKLRDELKAQKDLIIIFGSEIRGTDINALVKFGSSQSAKFICLGDYANSRGAADMGLLPDLLPGYTLSTPAKGSALSGVPSRQTKAFPSPK